MTTTTATPTMTAFTKRTKQPTLVLGAVLLAPLVGACTISYPLDTPPPSVPAAIAAQAPLDILFVVDNSPSMAEEQDTLVRSVFDERCPIADLRDVPEPFANAPPDVLEELAEVCGLAQLMAAINGDFHIGVITTDVGNCDERFAEVQDPDGLHTPTSMRGCLQGAANDDGHKFLSRDDDVLGGVQQAMLGVGTYGSSFERGMDAMKIFLDPASRRAPGCENDLDGFLRKDGQLLVIFVGDEDDCSHADGAYGFDNELENEPAGCGDFREMFLQSSATDCYEQRDLLAPVADYAGFLRGLTEQGRTTGVYVGVVGGLVESVGSDGGGFVPGGCVPGDEGAVEAQCTPTFGNSQICDENQSCCFADGSFRYAELAASVNSAPLMGSICAPDFRGPLLPIFFRSDLEDENVVVEK